MQSPLNPKETIRAYLTNTSQCPGEVGGKGCGSLSGLVPIRPLPHYPQFCSLADKTVFLTSPIWGEIPNPGKGFPFGLRLGGDGGRRTEALRLERGGTWPSRRSDIPVVPSGRFPFMPWGGDYSGFGLRGQERRKRFDLRAEAEPPSPSARVTHRGCGWEVDPERGLNQATGPGAGVWSGGRSRLSVAGETRGTRRAGEWRMQGSWTARRSHPLDLACRFRRRWDPLPQAGAGAGGVELPRRLLRVAPQVCGAVHADRGARFVLVTARPGSDTEPSSQPGVRNAGAAALGPAGAQGRSGPQRALECAGRSPSPGRAALPGSQIPPYSRAYELLLDSFSPVPAGLATLSF